MVVGELAAERDLVILGGGPGGYNAAIRAAQLGMEVTLIEQEELGGICLNIGCIPSKVFAHAGKKLMETRSYQNFGLEVESKGMNLPGLQTYKTRIIHDLKAGIQKLCQANQVEVIKGKAAFLSADRIGVETDGGFDVYRFKNALIATGASLKEDIGSIPYGKRILNQHTLYQLEEIPEHLIIFGMDYIALEAAFHFGHFGSRVTLISEGAELPFDSSINRELARLLKKAKIKWLKGLIPEDICLDGKVTVRCLTDTGESVTVEGSQCFYPAALVPNSSGLGLERIGVAMDENGFIKVDAQCRTSLPHLFAAGDVTEGVKLAVRAIKQGKIAAEAMAGKPVEADFSLLPLVVHTSPPIASVGITEEEAVSQGFTIKTALFPMTANGFAAIAGQKDGFVKIISDKENERILGFHCIGEGALELAGFGTVAIEMVAREEDLTYPLYPHPGYGEAVLEAAEGLSGRAVHLVHAARKVTG